MRKLSARWVPRFHTPDKKRNRETTLEQCLTLFKRNPKEFLRRFMTVDEAWILRYTPETKEQSKVNFTRRTCSEGIEDCPIGSAGKVMVTVFWNSQVDFQKISTTWRRAKRTQASTVPNYWGYSTPNCRKTAPFSKEKMLFHHDNHGTGSHLRCRHGQIGPIRLRTTAEWIAPYSPNLAPCNFFLFPNLKKSQIGRAHVWTPVTL